MAKYSIRVRIKMIAILTASRAIFSVRRQIISIEGVNLKIIVDSRENIAKLIADEFAKQIEEKPQSTVAFTAEKELMPIFDAINGDFTNSAFFNVCDFCTSNAETSGVTQKALEATLKRLSFGSVHEPDALLPEDYDAHITEHGGLDLILLGMTQRGAVGFNEPSTAYDTHTHTAKITDTTRHMYEELFESFETTPESGVTMGLKTICDAKTAIVAVFGSENADIVYKLVYGKTTTYVPAAMLQMHRNMILCLDPEAAAKL